MRRVQEVPGSIPGTALWAALRRLILGASLGCADVRARGPGQNTVMPIAPRGTQAPKGGVVQVRSVISAPAWACLAARAMLKRTFAPPSAGSLAERAKAAAQGAIPLGRGLEPHSSDYASNPENLERRKKPE